MGKRKRIIMSGLMLGGLCASLWALPGMLEKVQGMQTLTGIPLAGMEMGVVGRVEEKGLVVVVPSGEGLTAEARAALLREAEKQRGGEKKASVVRVVRD